VNDIKLVVLVNLVKLFLVFLQLDLNLFFLLVLLFKKGVGVHPGVYLDSFGGLLLVLFGQFDNRVLFNYRHVFDVESMKLRPCFQDILLDDLIVLLVKLVLESTHCYVDVLDDVPSLYLVDQDFVFAFEEQKCGVKLVGYVFLKAFHI
jgi:hypothetical protein